MRGKFIRTVIAITGFCIVACGLLLPPQQSFAQQVGDGVIEAGEDEVAELARAAQNPVANMISVPFQNNTNTNFGPLEKTQNVLNIQPVLPFEAPEGKESNWIPTKAGGRFELVFRFFGPEPALFDKTWVLPDLEQMN